MFYKMHPHLILYILHTSSYCVIVRVSVVLKRTVVGDRRFDNLSGSHLQSQVNGVFSVDVVIRLVR